MIFFFILIRSVVCTHCVEENTIYPHARETQIDIPVMPPVLALCLIFIRSNYHCLEHLFTVPKVFEPLKFHYIYMYDTFYIPNFGLFELHARPKIYIFTFDFILNFSFQNIYL